MKPNVKSSFFRLESAGGILLIAGMILALIAKNSVLNPWYDTLLDTKLEIIIGNFSVGKPLLLWINDGLMAVFFFIVGLELKREVLEGELSKPGNIVLPVAAAFGGMAVPAFIYSLINWNDPVAMKGWAIPAATDIAFALGVLSLLGRRVPASLKIFLLSLAIADDIGAIVIIAVFYTSGLSSASLIAAGIFILVLYLMNRGGVRSIASYLLVGALLWVAVLKSGVHATLAGVALAFFIPMKGEGNTSPVKQLEHDLHSFVNFIILPLFAFANSGIDFAVLSFSSLLEPVTLGIALGLILGKQAGVFGFSWLLITLRLAKKPHGAGWAGVYGIAALSGIGFTMSLFISSLAFEQGGAAIGFADRLGIITGSIVSALLGYFVLKGVYKSSI
ncbi:MAG: Na+/H+ antiporter NhaA [Bacteroidales bacterium]|nr:Na+/H+ antiporter NhaA [Bacteroidales bacterium]